ncbi:hypothetical protein [Terrarubrum flagellatum]|uniref:hypothetical protein n=1 Tax=Terrirubrum flagellatum TaxID=2895980 RepID=UPI0031452433
MAALIVTIILYSAVAALITVGARRNRRIVYVAGWRTAHEFRRLLPRLLIGIVGSGYIAEMLPPETVSAWLGHGSGVVGVAIGTVAGALTPGGPVVGYSLGAAALKAGAGAPQVVAYVTGWSLYTFNRMLVWELPTMPAWFVRLRVAISLPFPFIAAAIADFLMS